MALEKFPFPGRRVKLSGAFQRGHRFPWRPRTLLMPPASGARCWWETVGCQGHKGTFAQCQPRGSCGMLKNICVSFNPSTPPTPHEPSAAGSPQKLHPHPFPTLSCCPWRVGSDNGLIRLRASGQGLMGVPGKG